MSTQFTQRKKRSSVILTTPKRKRNWCFTLNNYTEKEIAQIHREMFNLNCKQFCFQEEKGENGIPHLQGTIAYKDARAFNVMKKILPKAHWEECRNLKASLAYCSKEDSRIGKTYTHNYNIIKIMTDEEFSNWEKKDMENEIEKTLLDMKGWSLNIV